MCSSDLLNVDVVLYNAHNTEHGQMFDKAGIPAVGFTTTGDSTSTYADWMHLLEDVFNEPGKMTDKISLGTGYVEDAQVRAAKIAETDKLSALVLMGVGDGKLTVAAGTEGWFTDCWAKRMNYTDAAAGTEGSALPVDLETVVELARFEVFKAAVGHFLPVVGHLFFLGRLDAAQLHAAP